MKCFLHIGTEKTATTTIQRFFDINRDVLLNQNFIYTSKAGEVNNWALAVAAYNEDRRDDVTKRYGLHTNYDLQAFQEKTIKDLKKEIDVMVKKRGVPNKEATVVFSSEHIQSRLTKVEEIERLKEIICSFGISDISVIVYLRRPADIASSLYSTTIKAGKILASPPSAKHPYWNNVCHHQNTIRKFVSVFGESAVIPRLFDRKEFKNGDILDDIKYIIGIPKDSLYRIPDEANPSLSLLGVRLLKNLNVTIPVFIENKPNPIRANLVQYMEKYFSNSRYIMPSHLYEEYDAVFQESNDWVKNVYFPHREDLFSKKKPDAIMDSILSESELKNISDFVASVWNDKQKRIYSLRKGNKKKSLRGMFRW